MRNTFIIYSQDRCKWCDKAKTLLTMNGLGFEVRDVGETAHLNYFKDQGFKTVPQIYVTKLSGMKHIGGYDDLEKWLEAGE